MQAHKVIFNKYGL